MPSLREIQVTFQQALYRPDAAHLVAAQIVENGIPATRRLQVYRNNLLGVLGESLRAVYPVVERLVGTAFFAAAARHYVLDQPSMSGDVHDYGGDFPEFMGAFRGAAHLPYIRDVAHLEWAYHEAFHSADDPALDPHRLLNVPEDGQAAIRLELQSSARLLSSAYPVLRIWQRNQPEWAGDTHVDLALGPDRILAVRRGAAVEIWRLGSGEFAWLEALSTGQTLGAALERSLDIQHDFDLTVALRRHLAAGTFVALA